MKAQHVDYTLYLATDRRILRGISLCTAVETAICAGVTVVQLREKNATAREFYDIADAVHEVCLRHRVPLIINDRIDIMLAVDAEGVHVGRNDMPLHVARRICRGRILGFSVNTLEHLRYAQEAGADYVGVGPVFATATKEDTGPQLGVDGVRALVKEATIPCIAIGGITEGTAGALARVGVAGIAAISSILGPADIGTAARALRTAFEKGTAGNTAGL